MNIFMYIFIIIGAIVAIGSTLAMIVTMIGTIAYKIYRKIKYHTSMYD